MAEVDGQREAVTTAAMPARVREAKRVLIIRPSALGDVCRSVPLAVSVKRALPGARVDWLVQDSFADAVRAHPCVDGVVSFPRARLEDFHTPRGALRLLRFVRSLRRAAYDVVIDAQGLFRSGFFMLASGAPVRVGYANAQEGASWACTHRAHAPMDRHAVERMLSLVACIGVEPVRDLRLTAPTGAFESVSRSLGLSNEAYVVIAPTSRWAAKLWPDDRFAAVTESLLSSGLIARAVIVGAGSERAQCPGVLSLSQRDSRVIDAMGKTSVAQLMALIEHSQMVIANDSAALHMAVGFNRPTVALYGPTEIKKVGPYKREHEVIQHLRPGDTLSHKDPARVEMMARICVDEVVQKATRALNEAAQRPA